MNQVPVKKKQIIWVNVIFFLVTTLGAVVGLPIYVHHFGVSTSELLLFVFFIFAAGLGITVGCHRLFAHATFKADPFVQFLVLFLVRVPLSSLL
jgi:stearoyl-CoA desaturase (Delta-9 desaturase)